MYIWEVIDALNAARPTSREAVDDILCPWNDMAQKYDSQPRGTAPQRYTRIYWYDETLHFQHVNREHPFSPDGWALLQVEKHFHLFPAETMEVKP